MGSHQVLAGINLEQRTEGHRQASHADVRRSIIHSVLPWPDDQERNNVARDLVAFDSVGPDQGADAFHLHALHDAVMERVS